MQAVGSSGEGNTPAPFTPFDGVLVRRPQPAVAEVVLCRPEVRNAFHARMIERLHAVFVGLAQDESLRLVCLSAQGPVFCAGADVNWMAQQAHGSWQDNEADALALAQMLAAIDHCPVPVLARVQGDAWGGGVGLLAVCDMVVAAQEARFAFPEVRLGLLPATIGPFVMRAMGPRAARRYFLSAERFTARQAQELGLVHEVCEAQALDAQIHAWQEALLRHGPQALRACKAMIHDWAGLPLDAGMQQDSARRIAHARASPQGQEGLAAFLAGRMPDWAHSASRQECTPAGQASTAPVAPAPGKPHEPAAEPPCSRKS
jgi:methylglutaconyl-CoA hydratase